MNDGYIYQLSAESRVLVRYHERDINSIQYYRVPEKKWVKDSKNLFMGVYCGFDDSEEITAEEAEALLKYFEEGKDFRRGTNWRKLLNL